MRGIALTLALLHDYTTIVIGSTQVTPDDLPKIVSGFLRKRRLGTNEGNLGWPPVKRRTVERDRSNLRIFSEFCAQQFGHFPLVSFGSNCPFPKDGLTYREVMGSLRKRNNMLLGHLFSGRPNANIMAAVGIKESIVRRRSNGKTFLSDSMIEDLILATPSVVQRMVFIQAAYGGPRLSEILNMWRCDVVPGRYRPTLFPDDVASDAPLIILAHPSQSRYIGTTRPGNADRLQHLKQTYRLTPRNMMDVASLKSGWKGMLFDNDDLLISQVFWSHRGWAEMYYQLFLQLRDEVLPLVPGHIRNSHPYLILNDSPSKDEFGRPMKISNIRKAFSRACQRIGIETDRFYEGIHGLRHSYKARLRKMGLTPEEIRKAMHHISIDSQQQYGQSSADLNKRLLLTLSPGGAE
ncbi:tyrosine-type recombinase/integrase [Azonexus sp. IMCC34839]|uniref:tyrosine-type recombinase/integrase n=1 Tax=Azonexus sp. IMCC34839 TaxID=3133695 RepID=UPI00399B67BA